MVYRRRRQRVPDAPWRWRFITKAELGDVLLVSPWLPHQEMNASETEVLHCALVRSGTEDVVVNLDIEPVAYPEWIA